MKYHQKFPYCEPIILAGLFTAMVVSEAILHHHAVEPHLPEEPITVPLMYSSSRYTAGTNLSAAIPNYFNQVNIRAL
ncbi:MAG: hypothetical protein ABII27_08125 [bacterium]